jgi:hypothetical protein
MTFSLPKESPSSASTSEMEAIRPQTARRQSRWSLRNHHEKHSNHGEIVRDVIIGFADGLTVPFALTAGLSSYVSHCHVWERRSQYNCSLGSSHLVIIGGLAELLSGAISMGLGAYLAAVTDRDHYIAEEKRERNEVINMPEAETAEIYEILDGYGIGPEASSAALHL